MIGRPIKVYVTVSQHIVSKGIEKIPEEDRISEVQKILCNGNLPAAGSLKSGQEYYTRKVKKLQPQPVQFVSEWVKIRKDRDVHALVNLHLSLLREVYPEERVQFCFRKFLAWYAAGYPGAHNFRKFIFNTENFADVITRAQEYFEEIKSLGDKAEIQRESLPVLMSGHG
jgi:tRNA-dihydrouridine synthase